MEAIARLGALECLRSGITTVGDCSFSGAAATACARARPARDRLPRGLRAGRVRALGAIRADCASASLTLLSDRVLLGDLAARARTPARSTSTAPATSSGFRSRRIWPRARPRPSSCSTGRGHVASVCRDARAAARDDRDQGARGRRAARPARCSPPTASRQTRRRSSCSPPTTSRSRTALARTRYLGCGVAPLARTCATPASASASRPTARPRRRRSTCSTRCARPSSARRARERRPDALSRLGRSRARHPRRSSRARARRRDRVARAGKAGGSDGSLARRNASSPVGRSRYGNRSRRLARAASSLLSSPARLATRKEGRHGSS